jgi:predicted transposase YdaD
MSKSKVTLEQVLIETGLAAKWEAQGEVRGEARGEAKAKAEVVRLKEGVARNLIQIGLSLEKIAEIAELEIETVKSLV